MITYWQEVKQDGVKTSLDKTVSSMQLVKVEESEAALSTRTWIDARYVTKEDVELLKNKYQIESEHILDILDPDELSRLEDGDSYILTILRLPFFDSNSDTQYTTLPLGIIIKDNFIITICANDCEVLKDFSQGRVKEVTLNDFPAFIMRLLGRANLTFLRYLKEINRHSIALQNELQVAVENKEIMQLYALEKSLVYFTTSLKSNQLLLERYRKTKLIKLDYDDLDWLDDIEIDSHQAIEMTETYRNVLLGVADSFDSIVNNNLNISMRRLSILNILMMVPTFITSFWGMNIWLPVADLGKKAPLIMLFLCILSVFITNIILGIVERHYPKTHKDSLSKLKQHRKEKTIERRIKSIEDTLSK